MKSSSSFFKPVLLLIITLFAIGDLLAQSSHPSENTEQLTATILHLDSAFWQSYNTCDVDKMGDFFSEDLEFYHDKGGLTTTRQSVVESSKTGLCGNEHWWLRREAVEGTVKVFPIRNYGAIVTGEHVFYINETGKKERLDGIAKFTNVWQYKNNEWKMSRVLSYDHKPAPYINKRKEVSVSAAALKQYAGKYGSAQAGTITITPEGATLKMNGSNSLTTLYAQSETMFFLKERDLQFEFVKGERNKVVKMIVHERGEVVEEAKKIK